MEDNELMLTRLAEIERANDIEISRLKDLILNLEDEYANYKLPENIISKRNIFLKFLEKQRARYKELLEKCDLLNGLKSPSVTSRTEKSHLKFRGHTGFYRIWEIRIKNLFPDEYLGNFVIPDDLGLLSQVLDVTSSRGIGEVGDIYHSMAFIWDSGILYLFDSEGTMGSEYPEILQDAGINVEMTSCPYLNFHDLKEEGTHGYCVAFSSFFIELSLLNPGKSIDQISSFMILSTSREIIRNYAAKMVTNYCESIDNSDTTFLDIMGIINDKFEQGHISPKFKQSLNHCNVTNIEKKHAKETYDEFVAGKRKDVYSSRLRKYLIDDVQIEMENKFGYL